MLTFIVKLIIFSMLILAISGYIFIDVYPILKLRSKEKVNINMVKFTKCILPYKRNS